MGFFLLRCREKEFVKTLQLMPKPNLQQSCKSIFLVFAGSPAVPSNEVSKVV